MLLLYAKGMQLKYRIIQWALTFCHDSLPSFTGLGRETHDEFELAQWKI